MRIIRSGETATLSNKKHTKYLDDSSSSDQYEEYKINRSKKKKMNELSDDSDELMSSPVITKSKTTNNKKSKSSTTTTSDKTNNKRKTTSTNGVSKAKQAKLTSAKEWKNASSRKQSKKLQLEEDGEYDEKESNMIAKIDQVTEKANDKKQRVTLTAFISDSTPFCAIDYDESKDITQVKDKDLVTICMENNEAGRTDAFVDIKNGSVKLLHHSGSRLVVATHDEEEDQETKKLEIDMKLKRSSTITEKDKKFMGKASEWKTIRYRDEKADELLTEPIRIKSRVYGHRDDVFTVYETRLTCSRKGSHTPTQPGISGHFGVPSDSIVAMAMGGYGDEDYGDVFIYTGQGGTDTENQTLNRYNISLVESMKRRMPVRLVRGYQLDSAYAPAKGYRYDGLYWVTDYWREPQRLKTGDFGALVYRYRMIRLEGQPPISKVKKANFKPKGVHRPSRNEYVHSQIVSKLYVKGTLIETDRDGRRLYFSGVSSSAWGNSFTLNVTAPCSVDISSYVELSSRIPYFPSILDKTLLQKYKLSTQNWRKEIKFSAIGLIPQPAESNDSTLGLDCIYNNFGVPIPQRIYQTNLELSFSNFHESAKVANHSSQPTLTFISKKHKHPEYVPVAYSTSENGIVSTSCFYSLLGNLSHYIKMNGGGMRKDLENYEQHLIDERVHFKNQLLKSDKSTLQERKVSNFKRVRNILDKL